MCDTQDNIMHYVFREEGKIKMVTAYISHCPLSEECAHEKLVEIPDTERRTDGAADVAVTKFQAFMNNTKHYLLYSKTLIGETRIIHKLTHKHSHQ